MINIVVKKNYVHLATLQDTLFVRSYLNNHLLRKHSMTLSEYYSKFFTGDPVKTNPKQEGDEKTSGNRKVMVVRVSDIVGLNQVKNKYK